MKIFSFILITLSILITSSLHGQWIVLDTFTGNKLYDIEFDRTFPPPDIGWVVSQQDTVFLTFDGGKSWDRHDAKISGTAFALKFINRGINLEGLMVGSSGQAWSSDDGGLTWQSTFSTGVTVNLLSIDFLRDMGSHAWAVGSKETIIYTPNQLSWSVQNAGGRLLLNSVDCVNRNSGWAVGNQGTILHTVNGSEASATWTPQASPVDVNLNDVYFVSSNKGWVAGDSGKILITISGGVPWEIQNTGITDNLFGISFSDINNGVAVGENGTILHTKNSGAIWVEESSPVNDLLYKVFYYDLENCWIIGMNSGTVLYSLGSITLTSPNGGDELRGGTRQDIKWESNYLQNVKIELSTNNGLRYDPVSKEAENWDATTGLYSWDVPDTVSSNNCLIRISSVTKQPQVSEVSDLFEIYKPDSIPPAIVILPASATNSGVDIPVSAKLTDASGIKEAFLNFRLAGESSFDNRINMTPSVGDTFQATIPWPDDDDDELRGFEFYIQARDASHDTNQMICPDITKGMTPESITINVVNVISRSITGSVPERPRYQMISIPLEFKQTEGSIDSILVDDFGPYDLEKPTEWRLLRWLTRDKRPGEFLKDPIGSFEPGKAFWLVARKNAFTVKAGKSVQSQEFEITLERTFVNDDPKDGWNQIGHPFAFSVSWNDVTIKDEAGTERDPSDISLPYLRNTVTDSYDPVNELSPWNGYFVKNRTMDTLKLIIPPIESNQTPEQSSFSSKSSSVAQTGWTLQISVESRDYRDDANYLGVAPEAETEWDRQDQPEPPTIGDYISLYFPHLSWERYPDYYATDFRPPFQDGESWMFEVVTNISDKVTLIFRGIEKVPSDFEIWLIDGAANITHNLRQRNYYSFASFGEGKPKPLRLVVGEGDFIADSLGVNQIIPNTFELAQNYPNPFNPTTTIRYGLPRAEKVTLKIYNLLGKEVVTLVNDAEKTMGYHVAIWDGRNQHGQPVSSGVYIYRLQTRQFTQAKKMILLQ